MVEVPIAVVQDEIVLEHERCDPQVVRGDGRALAPELAKGPRVVVRGLVVGVEDLDAVLLQETP